MRMVEADSSLKEAVGRFYKEQGYHCTWSDTERVLKTVRLSAQNRAALCWINSARIGTMTLL
ncbi:hypothetical protein GCM10007938_07880 [Vibrio zhanjiangensis]|uniref:Uncharacterized protein n=1 Tax=Vibrio zhanjiangensis TaxID=1046128 RepID=A0ABQ6EWE3_9VIBR|nr:hypothetical protein [Vibrio zhanjiangensis]GLT17011.1 hypothetical protein GCM10007938_07880 [Vibrio zhanjiangensis]